MKLITRRGTMEGYYKNGQVKQVTEDGRIILKMEPLKQQAFLMERCKETGYFTVKVANYGK